MAYTDYTLKLAFRQMLQAGGFSSSDAKSAAAELVDAILPTSVTTTGAIVAGSTVTATTTVTGTTGVTATTGNVAATAGAVTAGTTVTGATGVVATTGGVTATAGDVTATAGDFLAPAGQAAIGVALDATAAVAVDPVATAGTTQVGVKISGDAAATGTSAIQGVSANITTAAAAFTCAQRSQFVAGASAKGGGSTITSDVGVAITESSQGTENVGILIGSAPAGSTDYAIYSNSSNAVCIGDNSNIDTTDELQLIGDGSIADVGALGGECLKETDFATHANWDVTNDWDDTGGKAEWTWSANQTSTLTQVEADQYTADNIIPNHWYKLVYTVDVTTAPDGDTATTLTTGIAASAQTIDMTAGTKTLYFKSASAPTDFVISTVAGTGTEGQFGIDDISLKPVAGGDLNALGTVTGCLVGRARNWGNVGATADDAVDVTGISTLFCNAAGARTIGGLVGGVAGQVLRIVKTDTTDDLTLEDSEGGGNQDIKLADEADQTLATIGGWTLVCDGTAWYEVGY